MNFFLDNFGLRAKGSGYDEVKSVFLQKPNRTVALLVIIAFETSCRQGQLRERAPSPFCVVTRVRHRGTGA